MGGKAEEKEAPDFAEYTRAFKENSAKMWDAFDRQFEWAKSQDTRNNAILDQVLGIQLPAMQQLAQAGMEDRQRYKDVFVPAEDKYLAEVANYGNTEDQLRRSGEAQADVASSFESQRRAALDNLRSFGIQPGVAYAGLDARMRAQQAATQALVANRAMRESEMEGIGLRRDALGIGTGLRTDSMAGLRSAAETGSAAVNAAGDITQTGAAARMSGNELAGMGMDAMGRAQGAEQAQFDNQYKLDSMEAQQGGDMMGGIGSLVGTVGGAIMGGPIGAKLGGALGGALGGGEVLSKAGGGPVSEGPFLSQPLPGDTVPAMLNPDEYVIPKDIVMRKGTEFFDRLLEKTRNPAPQKKTAIPA